MIVPVFINKKQVLALVDTGADVSVIGTQESKTLNLPIFKYSDTVRLANDKICTINKMTGFNLKIGKKSQQLGMRIMNKLPSDKYSLIIGLDLMAIFGITINTTSTAIRCFQEKLSSSWT